MTIHILLVEDEDNLRAEVAEMLRLEDFVVTEASDGQEALTILQETRPDIVLCDVAMPNMDGYHVLEHIRKDEALLQLPFIFLTARADRQFVRHGMNLGADDYLTKPFSRKELLSAIDARLARVTTISEQADQKLDQTKKQLTRMVAHELRTPLVSMTMVQDVISNKLDDLSPTDLRDLFDMMQSGNKRMRHLVEQMVFYTQLNTGVIDTNTVETQGRLLELDFVINEAMQMGRSFAYRHTDGTIRRAQRKPYAPIKCLMKPLSFALAELVANALIYSPQGSQVMIQETVDDVWVYLHIVDSGPGLTTNRLRKASVPFEQIDREKQEQQGMGLGLPLAIKIVEIHNGELTIKETASHGTKVTVKLPLVVM
ncbi:MAG: response regulator [Chloroflexota bacterium]